MKSLARLAVHGALARKAIRRPAHCEKCGRKTKLHGHHHRGYSRENWLNVVWLCPRCHSHAHHSQLTLGLPSPNNRVRLAVYLPPASDKLLQQLARRDSLKPSQKGAQIIIEALRNG